MNEQELIKRIFRPGSKIMIDYVDDKGSLSKCGTEVEDLEESYLILRAPIVDSSPLVFRESQELTLRLLDDQKGEAHVTNVFIVDICQEEQTLLICSKPQKIDRTSLRSFSRFNVERPLKYSTEKTEGSGLLIDLSLLGCYAVIDPDTNVAKGLMLKITLNLSNEDEVIVNGKVVRLEKRPESGKVGLAINFHEASEEIKEAIYNYIFQIQMSSDHFCEGKPIDDGLR